MDIARIIQSFGSQVSPTNDQKIIAIQRTPARIARAPINFLTTVRIIFPAIFDQQVPRTKKTPEKLIETSSLPKRQVLFSFRALNPFPDLMSKHNSLKRKGGATGKRSVMKRFERVKLMKERGEWKAGQSAIGLPKTKAEG